jgi:hypothetical protein
MKHPRITNDWKAIRREVTLKTRLSDPHISPKRKQAVLEELKALQEFLAMD